VAGYAQTNLQLYRQMRESHPPEAVAQVAAGYELAVLLFTGRFRGSGKTFLAHLVGTASVLAGLRAPGAVVTAGVLHAAYAQGEFGSGVPGVTPAKRSRLIRAVGEEAEALVAGFTELAWDERSIPELLEGVATLGPRERDVVRIRLANELEDYLDLGTRYGTYAESDRKWAAAVGPACAELARRLGHAGLASDLERVFEESARESVPDALRRPHGGSYLVAPASHRPRARAALATRLARLRRRAARLLRRFASGRACG
jgi:(p)ppGpp synthase/HD superfamily hydrolase